MNTLIEQLAKQAGAGRRAGVGGLVFRDSELEKFAELIVRECIDILNKDDPHISKAPLLKEHFGIEE